MGEERFEVSVQGGTLAGTVSGAGPEVLLLHGGPGLSVNYLDSLSPELDGLRVARYQQRGVDPSTAREPYDVPTQVADVLAVLDHLGWARPLVLGHSWGGHLLLHVAAAQPDRVGAALVVDPLGAVGDGGTAEFEAEIERRLPDAVRDRAGELDRRALAGEGTAEEFHESLALIWPAYFATWDRASDMPPMDLGVAAYSETMASIHESIGALAGRLPTCDVLTRFVHGADSPMPVTASTESAALMAAASVDVIPDTGHFIWLESPGAVRRNLEELLDAAEIGLPRTR